MNKQLKFDKMFLNFAKQISQQSTCVSRQVGCVIVNDNRVISMGYNGTLSGCTHCNEIFDSNFEKDAHHKWALINEVHAELNALAHASKYGIPVKDSTLYSSLQPCNDCLKALIAFGVKRIVYQEKYEKSDYSDDICETIGKLNIKLEFID